MGTRPATDLLYLKAGPNVYRQRRRDANAFVLAGAPLRRDGAHGRFISDLAGWVTHQYGAFMTRIALAPALLAMSAIFPSISNAQAPTPAPALAYADLADLALAAPVALDARIRSATRLKGPAAGNVRADFVRYVVEADLLALIRGAGGAPPRIRYVVDLPLDSRGKAPKLKKQRVLLLARAVPGKPNDFQLVAPDAQIAWTAEADATLRAILTEALSPSAPPRITRVGNAFHVPGAIQGEGETQIFLGTESGQPVSLSVLRRPGQAPRWAVALGEIVDESAAAPRPDSLLWYRLACFLPRQLPASSLENADPAVAAQTRADYRVVIEGLGACTRTRDAALQPKSLPR